MKKWSLCVDLEFLDFADAVRLATKIDGCPNGLIPFPWNLSD